MNYHLQTKGFTGAKDVSDILTSDNKPFTTLGSAVNAIFELLEYQPEEIAEVLVCTELGQAVYSVKPTGNRAFHVQELF